MVNTIPFCAPSERHSNVRITALGIWYNYDAKHIALIDTWKM